jgi:hypothetical protein
MLEETRLDYALMRVFAENSPVQRCLSETLNDGVMAEATNLTGAAK